MDFWMRRARKELAVSGRLAEMAYMLATQEACHPANWQQKLQQLLLGIWEPNMDELIRLDGVLSRPKKAKRNEELTLSLF